MADLKVNYLGLELRSPIIVSSSGLTDSVTKIREAEDAGAGAVVLKSLFQEQLEHEAGLHTGHSDYPEADDYIRAYTKDNSVDNYLKLIEDAKAAVDIPVIASVNCTTATQWLEFAKKIESAGADAMEVNVFFLPKDSSVSGEEKEKLYFDLAATLKESINIPLAFKLSPQFSNILNMVDSLYNRKLDGVVLFNRFYEPDIDINSLKMVHAEVFSKPSDLRQTLRWVGMMSHTAKSIDIAASTGVHDGEAAIKLLLAGATAVQVCSVLYKKGIAYISEMIADIENWMNEKGFETVDDFRGSLGYGNIPDPSLYERSQFMKYFSNHH